VSVLAGCPPRLPPAFLRGDCGPRTQASLKVAPASPEKNGELMAIQQSPDRRASRIWVQGCEPSTSAITYPCRARQPGGWKGGKKWEKSKATRAGFAD